MGSGRRVWRASEEAAVRLLEEMGYRVVALHERILVGGVEVGEVDVVAEKEGERYAVEVKAGSLDVSGVRQAYVNARLLGARPLVVARGADDKARALARELGVELIILPDIVYAGFDEVRQAVAEALYSALDDVLSFLEACPRISDEDLRILKTIAQSETISDAAQALGVTVEEAGSIIAGLARKGILPRGPYRRLRLAARILVACKSLSSVPRP